MTEKGDALENEVFNLAVYTLGSAKILRNEPSIYCINRLFTAFKKLADLSYHFREPDNVSFWSEIRDLIKKGEKDSTEVTLDHLLSRFLREALRKS